MQQDWLGLSGKTCVVTGGARGIGLAIAEGLAGAGARVVVLDLAAEDAERAASALGADALGLACDTSDEASVTAAAERVRSAHGRCDVLVNNAAVFRPMPLIESTLKDWNDGLAVNLSGYYNCVQAFGRLMMENGAGAMVHIGSIAAFTSQFHGVDYSATKAAITGFSRQVAIEWGGRGIRSNVVHPGLTKTPLTAERNTGSDIMARRARMTAAKRMGEPDDIANAVMFLASERSSYVTGADMIVDGGLQRMLTELVPNATRISDFEKGLRQ
ncbi:MAG: SDR family oxidoreductase [Rhizobium sp.]|nr:SDR family oxidoreductase [Rhizobium sp.]